LDFEHIAFGWRGVGEELIPFESFILKFDLEIPEIFIMTAKEFPSLLNSNFHAKIILISIYQEE
jgi:hypothetical protein